MKITAIAAAACAMFAGVASADPAETKGGLLIKTDDGRFEAKLGGRIHFDGNLVNEDDGAGVGTAAGRFGSASTPAQSGFYFRRIYMTLTGKAYGWRYKIEPDFAPNTDTGALAQVGFQDVTMATDIGPGEIQIGQRKPFRAMEDLTSSNDVLMIERPIASASGGMLAAGASREFQDGLFYHGNGDQYTWGVGFYSLRALTTATTEGIGESVRFTYAPLQSEGQILHVGVSYSGENPAQAGVSAVNGLNQQVGASGRYAGRRGPSMNLGTTGGKLGTIGGELAGAFGPGFFQAEYMTQKQDADIVQNAASRKQTIDAYYIQASFFVTGETKPYKKADGVFGNPKPINPWGAVELTARYEAASNKDIDATSIGGSTATSTNVGSCATATAGQVTKCDITSITVGANYYVNPNVRFMLNYVMGEADRGVGGKDKPKTVAARAQFSF